MKPTIVCTVLMLTATPMAAAAAQMNPAAIGQGMVMNSAINAQAHRRTADGAGSGAESSDAQICAQLPQFRRKFGAQDGRILRLGALCRRAGYPVSH